jgi:hypothetical protein
LSSSMTSAQMPSSRWSTVSCKASQRNSANHV